MGAAEQRSPHQSAFAVTLSMARRSREARRRRAVSASNNNNNNNNIGTIIIYIKMAVGRSFALGILPLFGSLPM